MRLATTVITNSFFDLDKVEALAKEAFPPEEYLPPSKLIAMAKEEGFDFLALYDKGTFVGFITIRIYKDLAYLFFLAIDSSVRSHGYGSRAIETLLEEYSDKQHIVDLEMVDDAAENNEQRIKRRSFYLRNGYQPTGQFLSYLGVDYEILCMGDHFDFDTFKEMMATLDIKGFCPKYFSR